jgi:hypothetical protein
MRSMREDRGGGLRGASRRATSSHRDVTESRSHLITFRLRIFREQHTVDLKLKVGCARGSRFTCVLRVPGARVNIGAFNHLPHADLTFALIVYTPTILLITGAGAKDKASLQAIGGTARDCQLVPLACISCWHAASTPQRRCLTKSNF